MKNLSGEEMVDVFQRLIKEKSEKPHILRTDQGSEYKNRHFNRLLNENNIKHLYTLNDFRLMRLGSKNHKLIITTAVWKVCYISLNPNMKLAYDEALKISPAVYPFW